MKLSEAESLLSFGFSNSAIGTRKITRANEPALTRFKECQSVGQWAHQVKRNYTRVKLDLWNLIFKNSFIFCPVKLDLKNLISISLKLRLKNPNLAKKYGFDVGV